jgi:hypothetical protein
VAKAWEQFINPEEEGSLPVEAITRRLAKMVTKGMYVTVISKV